MFENLSTFRLALAQAVDEITQKLQKKAFTQLNPFPQHVEHKMGMSENWHIIARRWML